MDHGGDPANIGYVTRRGGIQKVMEDGATSLGNSLAVS